MAETTKKEFNIFTELRKELEHYNNDHVMIVAQKTESGLAYLSKKPRGGYRFTQKDTLDLVELYYNSKLDSPMKDSENQRKLILNMVKFKADVAKKMTDIDTKDYLFIPDTWSKRWAVFMFARQFRKWTRSEGYAEQINFLNKDYSKVGTCVSKSAGGKIMRVPVRNIRNPQAAKSLKSADWVIEEHEWNFSDFKEYPDWKTKDLDPKPGTNYLGYERYGYAPEKFVNEMNGKKEEGSDEMVRTMCIMTLDEKKDKKSEDSGHILFIEKVDEWPYDEAHWDRVDGRWLGVGEVELNFENQIAKNYFFNMRRKSTYWSSKRLFQSASEGLPKSLVRDVKDGTILKINPNGPISEVNTSSQNLGDIQGAMNDIDKTSDQLSFTFEVATGESAPSGTPFRLGVLLSNAVKGHFDEKKENFAIFLKRQVTNDLIPLFKSNLGEKNSLNITDEDDLEDLREALVDYYTNERVKESIFSKGVLPDYAAVRADIEDEISKRTFLTFEVMKNMYDDLKTEMEIALTDESINVPQKIESMTTLLQAIGANPMLTTDPAMRQLLAKIVAMTGENLNRLIGRMKAPQPGQMPQMGAPGAPGGASLPQGTPGAVALNDNAGIPA